jgi:hypothetical protein
VGSKCTNQASELTASRADSMFRANSIAKLKQRFVRPEGAWHNSARLAGTA